MVFKKACKFLLLQRMAARTKDQRGQFRETVLGQSLPFPLGSSRKEEIQIKKVLSLAVKGMED